jgi:hypothetical protein
MEENDRNEKTHGEIWHELVPSGSDKRHNLRRRYPNLKISARDNSNLFALVCLNGHPSKKMQNTSSPQIWLDITVGTWS